MRAAARTQLSALGDRCRTSELGDAGVACSCDLPRRRQPGRPGPEVLSGEEVSRLIACTTNIKHRAFLLTLYSAGLRLNENTFLKAPDDRVHRCCAAPRLKRCDTTSQTAASRYHRLGQSQDETSGHGQLPCLQQWR